MRGDVLIADDHELVAMSLCMALERRGLRAAALPVGALGLADLLDRLRSATTAVVDLDLGPGPDGVARDGVMLLAGLRRAAVPTVVLTGADDPARWGECLAHGAATVVPKGGPLDHLLGVITALAERRRVPAPSWHAEAASAWRRRRDQRQEVLVPLGRLTPREREVLVALGEGLSVAEVAARDEVSVQTVRTQVRAVLQKLQVTSQLQAVATLHRARALAGPTDGAALLPRRRVATPSS